MYVKALFDLGSNSVSSGRIFAHFSVSDLRHEVSSSLELMPVVFTASKTDLVTYYAFAFGPLRQIEISSRRTGRRLDRHKNDVEWFGEQPESWLPGSTTSTYDFVLSNF